MHYTIFLSLQICQSFYHIEYLNSLILLDADLCSFSNNSSIQQTILIIQNDKILKLIIRSLKILIAKSILIYLNQ